ncbi:hypothetical protein E2C01_026797 [Portunus trituberculatus]|uniref:Uncharacterized protein n=1 Tax=Portunus trituberculatus TaxID=210409 RepID=A0A5B7EJM3_PORTR|nr:hypothetical protein [Portunus trituberculatus]
MRVRSVSQSERFLSQRLTAYSLHSLIMVSDRSANYNVEDAVPPPQEGPVKEKSLVIRKDSRWLYDEDKDSSTTKIRLATILLSSFNFSIEVPMIEQSFGKPLETIQEEPEDDEENGQHHSNNVNSTEEQVSESYDNVAYVNDSKP